MPDRLEHLADVRSQGDPHPLQLLALLELVRRLAADGRQRPLDRPDHVGDRDRGAGPGQPVAPVATGATADQTVLAELGEDVAEEGPGIAWARASASFLIGDSSDCALRPSSTIARTA